jgi:hypothetical protein
MFLEGLLRALASRAHIPIVPIRFGFLSLAEDRSADAEALFGLLWDTRREAAAGRPRTVRPSFRVYGFGEDGDMGEVELLACAVGCGKGPSFNELFSDGESAPF